MSRPPQRDREPQHASGSRSWRAAGRLVAPAAAAACAGALVAGAVEVSGAGLRPAVSAAAVGFAAALSVPVAVAVTLVARGLWRAWQPERVAASVTERSGGAPVLAAWGVYLVAALALLGGACSDVAAWLDLHTHSVPVLAFGVGIAAVVVALILAAVSRPLVRVLAAALRAADARISGRFSGSVLRPRYVVPGIPAVGAAVVYAFWRVSIAPRIGPLHIGVVPYVVTFVVVFAAVEAVWPRVAAWPRARAAFGWSVGGVVVAAVAWAGTVRFARPDAMLDAWQGAPTAAETIELSYGLHGLYRHREVEISAGRHHRGPRPNILLITIDTLRADHTPPYGGTAKMPNLEALAKRGTVFDWAFSPGNVTRRSLPSLATGLTPARVRGRVAGWALRLDPRHVMLAEYLQAAGYDTAGFFCCQSQFAPKYHLGLSRGIEHLTFDKDSRVLARRARAWVEARRRAGDKAPYFIWMHLIEPHEWVVKYGTGRTRADYRAHYDRALALADKALGILFAPGDFEDAVTFLTADHGEGLDDHGFLHHASSVYDSQIHVPLIVAGPGVAVQRIAKTASLIDLAPTILDLAGLAPPGRPVMDGRSIAPALSGDVKDARALGVAYSYMVRDRSVATSAIAVVRGRYRLIRNGGGSDEELYDVKNDPMERHDLAGTRPKLRARLEVLLRKRRRLDRVSPFSQRP